MLKKVCKSPQKVHSVNSLGVCAQYHHNRFFNMFFMLPWVGQFLMKDFQAFLLLIMFLLTFLSFKSLLMTSFHVFLGRPLEKLPLTLKVPHLLDQALSSILYIWPNHCIFLSWKHSLMIFNFNGVRNFSAEILSLDETLQIRLTFLVSFFSSLLKSSTFTGQASLLYSIRPHAYAKYNLFLLLRVNPC